MDQPPDPTEFDIACQTAAGVTTWVRAMLGTMGPAGAPDCALQGMEGDRYILAALVVRMRMIEAVERGDDDAARETYAAIRNHQRAVARLYGFNPELVPTAAPSDPEVGRGDG